MEYQWADQIILQDLIKSGAFSYFMATQNQVLLEP